MEAKESAVIALDYVVDEGGLLYFCPRSATNIVNRAEVVRLVISILLQDDILHHYHAILERGIKEWAAGITACDLTFIQEVCSEEYNIMWGSVSIVKPGRDVRCYTENIRETCKLRIHFR